MIISKLIICLLPDENMSVQILDETEQKDQLPVDEVVEVTFGHVKQSSCRSGWSKYGSRCFMLVHRELSWLDAEVYTHTQLYIS